MNEVIKKPRFLSEGIDLKRWMAESATLSRQLRRRKALRVKAAESKVLTRQKRPSPKPALLSADQIRIKLARKKHAERSALAQRHIKYARILRENYRKR